MNSILVAFIPNSEAKVGQYGKAVEPGLWKIVSDWALAGPGGLWILDGYGYGVAQANSWCAGKGALPLERYYSVADLPLAVRTPDRLD